MQAIGWSIGRKNGLQFYIRHLPIFGNFVKILRPQKPPNPKTIDILARQYHAFAVQVNYSPTKTLQLNLTKSEEEIFSRFKKDARYEIKKAEKNKITVEKSSDIESFIKMWHKNALRRGFWIPMKREIQAIWEAFGKDVFIIEAVPTSARPRTEKPLAGALVLIQNHIAYYFHATSTPEGRKLSAPYLVVWEAIKLAKKKNCRVFDFEGIYDERFPIKSWKGFTHFKKSFGGEEIEFPGSFVKFYNPILNSMSRLHKGV